MRLLFFFEHLEERSDEGGRWPRVDGVSIGLESSHALQNPSSQPANCGWREPTELLVGALDVLGEEFKVPTWSTAGSAPWIPDPTPTEYTCDGSGDPPAEKVIWGPPFSPPEARSVDQRAKITSRSGLELRSRVCWLAERDLWSEEVAVGQRDSSKSFTTDFSAGLPSLPAQT